MALSSSHVVSCVVSKFVININYHLGSYTRRDCGHVPPPTGVQLNASTRGKLTAQFFALNAAVERWTLDETKATRHRAHN